MQRVDLPLCNRERDAGRSCRVQRLILNRQGQERTENVLTAYGRSCGFADACSRALQVRAVLWRQIN